MKKMAFLCVLLFFASVSLKAQSIGHSAKPEFEVQSYEQLQSKGDVPNDFRYYLTSKLTKEEYYYKHLIASGLLVYGSSMNDYIDQVADNLLVEFPELRKELRFYVVKSPVVNAASYPNGMILVNVGLLAQLQNESELAFILAHEIVHYAEKHVEKEEQVSKKEKNDTDAERFLKYQVRSREHETEADQLALTRYYIKSKYSCESFIGVFDVLQYAYLPFNEVPFERSFVETDYYQFPDEVFLSAVSPIRAREDYIDTLDSHPNILKRRAWAESYVGQLTSSVDRKAFLQPEDLFYKIRYASRLECINMWLTIHSYDNAFYNSYVMLQENPNNEFLRRTIYLSLYGIAKHRSNNQLNDVMTDYHEVEGEKQQVNYFCRKVSRNELLLLALRFAWEDRKINPNDNFSSLVINDIINALLNNKALVYNNYCDFPMGYVESEVAPEVKDTVYANKYDRIREKGEKRDKVKPDPKFKTLNYMLVALRKEPQFWTTIDSIQKLRDDEKVLQQLTEPTSFNLSSPMIVWNPMYIKRKLGQSHFIDCSPRLGKTINKICNKLKINDLSLNIDTLILQSTASYNLFCKLQNWFYDYQFADGTKMIFYQSYDIQECCDAIGSSVVNCVSAYSYPYRFGIKNIIAPIVSAILVPLASPLIVANVLSFQYTTKAAFSVIDMTNSEFLYENTMDIDAELTDAYLHNFLYENYYILNNKGGKK